ncbi:integral membrane protein [Actinomadura sp. NBRC 104425]|uniref:M56 family metallopeptidase n=1 Tax=Actinomadura sp. NBRC 104425 TaxID=3032204 RepID=UPI0024A5ED9E|nr:M56 family metallopeptidase [Actinomadura sp. NBRC 104425]GLZ14584.1 integral membrane protein [Actinomadura sp. NBRC 104425]
MTGAALLALISIGTVGGAHLLSRARWTWRSPRTAIALWQALGLGWGVATIGALLGFALLPYDHGIVGGVPLLLADHSARLDVWHVAALLAAVTLAAVLLAMLAYAVVRVVRARRRHRALLALISRRDAAVPGTLVLDHPAAAAYCVPGVRSSKVVVSAGTLELLDPAELAAVLAHERAHARERHDLVLLPFASLRQVFPQIGLVGRCLDAVELLIEMAADDRARRHRSPRELATALLRFAAARPAAAPSGTLGVATADDIPVMARVNRLLQPVPLGRPTRVAATVAVPLLALVPLLLYALPH